MQKTKQNEMESKQAPNDLKDLKQDTINAVSLHTALFIIFGLFIWFAVTPHLSLFPDSSGSWPWPFEYLVEGTSYLFCYAPFIIPGIIVFLIADTVIFRKLYRRLGKRYAFHWERLITVLLIGLLLWYLGLYIATRICFSEWYYAWAGYGQVH